MDWLNEDENPDDNSYELTSRKVASASGTVFISDTNRDQASPVVGLNDIFSISPHTSRLNNLFVKPSKSVDGHDALVISTKDLFGGGGHNTITKSRLSGIIASLDNNNQSSSDQVFAWPVGTKSSSTPTSTFGLKADEEEYPHDIDFLEDSNEPAFVEESVAETIPKLQEFRMPKSTPVTVNNNCFPAQHGGQVVKDESILQMSVSNMHNPVSSLFAEDIRYSSIRNETSMLDLQPVSAPAAEEPMIRRENLDPLKDAGFIDDNIMLPSNASLIIEETAEQPNMIIPNIKYVPSFSKDLARVNISNSKLADLQGLSDAQNLSCLRASGNIITSLDPIMKLSNLTSIDVSNNSITTLDFKNCCLHKLNSLNVEGNRLSSILHVDVLQSLHILVLGANSLEYLLIKRPLMKLEHLDISDNLFSTFNGSHFPNLTSLNLDRNMAESISKISNVQILSVASQRASSSKKLLIFDFSGSELYLSGNIGPPLNEEILKNAEVVDLSHCSLSSIPHVLMNAPKLKVLHLEHNSINDLSTTLCNLKDLQFLNLSSNNLSDITRVTKSLAPLGKLSTLDIRDNLFISKEIKSQSQLDVARIVLHSCFLTSCVSLHYFNREQVSSSSRRKAAKRMAALKSNAASRMKSSGSHKCSVFNNWVPQLQPLQADMTVDEELVLEVLM